MFPEVLGKAPSRPIRQKTEVAGRPEPTLSILHSLAAVQILRAGTLQHGWTHPLLMATFLCLPSTFLSWGMEDGSTQCC